MSLALNNKPASQRVCKYGLVIDDSINVIPALEKLSSTFLFSWICVCVPRELRTHCIYSVSRYDPTRVLQFERWIQIRLLSFFYTSILFSPLRFCSLSFLQLHLLDRVAHFYWDYLSLLSFTFALLFPHTWSLSCGHCFSLSSCGHLPCIHASLFVPRWPKGQVSRYCSPEWLTGPPQTPTSTFRLFHALHCRKFSTMRNSVLVERSLWILSESHQGDNCPVPGNPNSSTRDTLLLHWFEVLISQLREESKVAFSP